MILMHHFRSILLKSDSILSQENHHHFSFFITLFESALERSPKQHINVPSSLFFFFCVIAFRRSANYDENSKSLRKRLMKIIMKKKTLLFLVSEVFSCLHILSCRLRNMKHERRDPTTFWEL